MVTTVNIIMTSRRDVLTSPRKAIENRCPTYHQLLAFATAMADTLSAMLARSDCSLSSLVVQRSGVSDLASAGIMMSVADNTVLRTLDLSGNDIGGTSDFLAGVYPEQGVGGGSYFISLFARQ